MNDLFAGGGEMGALMRSTDWSKTKLGPVEQWPRSLKTMLGVVLGSRFPMLLWWGPDLLHLYNDAYRPILRDKHPASLGAPAAEVWAEVWDVAGPMARGVQEGGPATWTEDLQLFIKSGDMAEETYFTFSYSPVPGDDGGVGGILNTVQETTAKVQGQRQIRMLRDLAARAAEAKSEEEACCLAVEVLAANTLDLPFVLLYLAGENAGPARLVAQGGWKDCPASWPCADLGRPHVAIPLLGPGRPEPYAFLVAGVSPHRAMDERYKLFFRAVADQVGGVLTNARAYETLSRLDKAKTAFFSNISHEFRTPLTLLLGPTEDLLADAQQPLSPRHRQSLEIVHHNALRLLKLVNALLDFSRIEAGRMTALYAPLDISKLTRELASSFSSAAERAGLKLVIDCPPMDEPAYLDREMWEKIVLNLLSNAFKFTFEGSITVSLERAKDAFLLRVRDTGCGIPREELPRLFERFHRVQGAKSRSHEGTGIGLSLVRELARQHGGSIEAESVEGEGTTFTVSIPRGKAHLPAQAVADAPRPAAASRDSAFYGEEARRLARSTPAARAAKDGKPRQKILFVDDNADLRAYVAELLGPHYGVETAVDGLDGLERARKSPPDLVLSDFMMPRLDGRGLVRELRKNAKTRSLPIILLSARAGEESVAEGLGTGADDYLMKPFSSQELLARVRTHLALAQQRRQWTRELEEANRELEAFSYSVSHDLRAPLRHVDGFIGLVRERLEKGADAETNRYLDIITESTGKMNALIEALLSFSRMSRVELRKIPVRIKEIVEPVIQDYRPDVKDRNIQWKIGDLPEVSCDPQLMRLAVANLVGNAIKFTKAKDPAVIEIGSLPGEPGQAVLFIRDNGSGFDMKYASKLFEVFQRLHRQEEFEGIGIGLANVRRIVLRHKGRVWAEGAEGKGATFYVSLPLDPEGPKS